MGPGIAPDNMALPMPLQARGTRQASGRCAMSDHRRFWFARPGNRVQGWAATSPMLASKGGLYCEDCDVAAIATGQSPRFLDFAPCAVDEESAERLWVVSEE